MLLSISTPVWRRYGSLFPVVSSSARLMLLLRGVVRFTGTGGYGYSPSFRSPTGSSWSLQSPLVPPGIEGDGNGGRPLVRGLRLSRTPDMVPSFSPCTVTVHGAAGHNRWGVVETPLPVKTQGRNMDRILSV